MAQQERVRKKWLSAYPEGLWRDMTDRELIGDGMKAMAAATSSEDQGAIYGDQQ